MSALWPIVSQAVKHLQRTAVIDDRRTYTYGQLLGGALFLAEQIESRTGRPHVGLLLPTSGAFSMGLMGAWFARRAAVPLNYLLAPDELRYVIADCDADTILTTKQMIEFIGADRVPPEVKLVHVEELDYTGLPPVRWPPITPASQTAVILYTSGTSGRPKGVMLTHGNLRSNALAGIEHAQITHADTFLGVLPQFHSFGLTGLTLIPLYVGSKVVYSARFVPKRIVELIRKHRPEVMMAVPSMYGALLSVKDAKPEDFASVRIPVSGGEPLPQAVFDQFQQRLNVRLLEGYGLTETSPVTHWSTPTRWKAHSVGTALPGVEHLIVDERDRPLPPGEAVDGEILLNGPNIMKGYYKLPQQTAATFVEISGRRWFRTGDIGRIDADGFLSITGRKKEMLIIGGENVFPREIEEVLNKHPSVNDSAVIGKQDGMRGEVPIAFVEIKEGQAFDDGVLRTWCRDHLAQYKVPRDVRQVEHLPRSPTGKILRRQLKVE